MTFAAIYEIIKERQHGKIEKNKNIETMHKNSFSK